MEIPENLPIISAGRKTSTEDKIMIAESICNLYATDKYTMKELLLAHGIKAESTWVFWRQELNIINTLYKNAIEKKEKVYYTKLKERAKTALERRIDGELITLETRRYKVPKNAKGEEMEGVQMELEKTEREVYIPPSDTAIQIALYNHDAKNFNKNPNGIIEKDNGEYDEWTDEQIEDELKRLDESGY